LPDFCQKKGWEKPEQGVLKINSDGAFFEQSGDGGWGYVIRHKDGRVWKAGGGREDFLQSAFHSELLGCFEGLKIAAQMGMTQVILETDATTVKTALQGDEYRLSPMGGMIIEIKHFMAAEFSMCRVNVCPRVCNNLAHELASIGCKMPSGDRATLDCVPSFLEGLVSSDSAVAEV